jgi:hypothetical protein
MMTIIAYRNNKDIDVQFIDGTIVTNREYSKFKNGQIKNPNYASVYNVGYMGQGSYSKVTDKDAYKVWQGMLRRCYDSKLHVKRPTYIGCEVCEEWHSFQNFAKWFYDNYYELPDQTMALDKDILCKGNKVYSPDTCVFAPSRINTLFIRCGSRRGELPIGVSYHKRNNKYQANCNDSLGHEIYLGLYNTPEEAFEAYKQYKEQTIKDMAEEHRNVIPEVLYNAMINYEVEIED